MKSGKPLSDNSPQITSVAMKLQRTPRLKLKTTPEQEQALDRTSPQYKDAKQYALDTAWEHGSEPKEMITTKSKLEDLVK